MPLDRWLLLTRFLAKVVVVVGASEVVDELGARDVVGEELLERIGAGGGGGLLEGGGGGGPLEGGCVVGDTVVVGAKVVVVAKVVEVVVVVVATQTTLNEVEWAIPAESTNEPVTLSVPGPPVSV